MRDKEFLKWIHNRMIHVHNENPNVDYLHKLRSIIDFIDEDVTTPNICSKGEMYFTKEPKDLGKVS